MAFYCDYCWMRYTIEESNRGKLCRGCTLPLPHHPPDEAPQAPQTPQVPQAPQAPQTTSKPVFEFPSTYRSGPTTSTKVKAASSPSTPTPNLSDSPYRYDGKPHVSIGISQESDLTSERAEIFRNVEEPTASRDGKVPLPESNNSQYRQIRVSFPLSNFPPRVLNMVTSRSALRPEDTAPAKSPSHHEASMQAPSGRLAKAQRRRLTQKLRKQAQPAPVPLTGHTTQLLNFYGNVNYQQLQPLFRDFLEKKRSNLTTAWTTWCQQNDPKYHRYSEGQMIILLRLIDYHIDAVYQFVDRVEKTWSRSSHQLRNGVEINFICEQVAHEMNSNFFVLSKRISDAINAVFGSEYSDDLFLMVLEEWARADLPAEFYDAAMGSLVPSKSSQPSLIPRICWPAGWEEFYQAKMQGADELGAVSRVAEPGPDSPDPQVDHPSPTAHSPSRMSASPARDSSQPLADQSSASDATPPSSRNLVPMAFVSCPNLDPIRTNNVPIGRGESSQFRGYVPRLRGGRGRGRGMAHGPAVPSVDEDSIQTNSVSLGRGESSQVRGIVPRFRGGRGRGRGMAHGPAVPSVSPYDGQGSRFSALAALGREMP